MEHNKALLLAIIDRMKTVLGVEHDKDVADGLGIPRGTFSVWKRRGTVPYEECIEMARKHNISLDWLLLGRGRKELPSDEPEDDFGGRFAELGLYDAETMCKATARFETWLASPSWLQQEGLEADDNTIVVRAAGDAMAPIIKDGQLAIIDLRASDKDGVYLIRSGDTVLFRRVQRLSDGAVKLICDNHAYAAETIRAADVPGLQLLGRVHAVIATMR